MGTSSVTPDALLGSAPPSPVVFTANKEEGDFFFETTAAAAAARRSTLAELESVVAGVDDAVATPFRQMHFDFLFSLQPSGLAHCDLPVERLK